METACHFTPKQRKCPYLLEFLTTLVIVFLKESISAESQAALPKIFFEHRIYREQFASKNLVRIFCQDHKPLLCIIVFIQLSLFVSFSAGKVKLTLLCELAQLTGSPPLVLVTHMLRYKPGSSFGGVCLHHVTTTSAVQADP